MPKTAHRPTRLVVLCMIALLCWASFVAVRVAQRAEDDAAAAPPAPTGGTASAAPAVRTGSQQPRGALPWPQQGQAAVAVGDQRAVTSGAARPVPIASVAKMMTAYLVLRAHPLDGAGFTVTIMPQDAVDQQRRAANDESVLPVAAGEVLTERQLLQGLLLPSGNNIAILLAVHEAGSVAGFVDRMNAAARSLGMHDSTYTDPSGLDAGTVSTAADQLILLRKAMGNRDFAALVRQRTAQLPVAGTVHNTNPLLGHDGFVGAKTGSDDAAGGCLAFVAVRVVAGRDVTVYGVVLAQRGPRLIDAAAGAARALTDATYNALLASG